MSDKETRAISGLVIDYNQRVHDWNPCVGPNGITKIERSWENGEMARVPWFDVYVGDEIIWRVSGKYVVEISYGEMRNQMSNQPSNEFDYATRDDVNIAILRETAKIRFRERLPLVMEGVAKELLAAGVDFSKARFSTTPLTDEDVNSIYEDLF
jgi:hypothetical protein